MSYFASILVKFKLTLLFVCVISTARAATYYFSTSQGDDNRTSTQAQSPSTPWKTISKLNAIFSTLAPGDVILFNRGEVFEGAIVVTKSGVAGNPIKFGAYGTGAKPVISCFATLSGWVNLGNGIWEAPLSTDVAMLNMVTINNIPYAMGRYPNATDPNKGYLTIDAYVSNTQITDNQLPSTPNWKDAEVVIRKNRWIIDRNLITSHSGTAINYTSASSYNAGIGYGYFIQNHPQTLDTLGEWYLDKANKKLHMHFGTNSPGNYVVKASRKEAGVALQENDYLSFENLSFHGANLKVFDVYKTTGISVISCDILNSGRDVISGSFAQNVKLENSTITNTLSTVVSLLWQCPGAVIRNNTIKNTGFIAGMGGSDNFTYSGIIAIGDNVLIEGNKIEETGATALSFRGNNAICRKNFVDRFAFIKDDQGAIHVWNNMDNFVPFTGQEIKDNIILNGVGAPEGTAANTFLSEGIYIDDNSAGIEVARNTVSQCGKGLFIHNAHEINIHDNTFFDNRDYQAYMEHDKVAADKPIRKILFNNNILASKDPAQGLLSLRTKDNDIAQFGTLDSNYFTPMIGGNAFAVNVITGRYTSSQIVVNYNLEQWKTTVYGFDANSVDNTPVPPIPHYKINSLGANKFPNPTFTDNITSVTGFGPGNNLKIEHDKTNKLDGNSLKASFPTSSTATGRCAIYANIGAVDAAKKYIVRFSVFGEKTNRAMYVNIELDHSKKVARKSFKTTTTRRDYEFLMEPSASLTSARLLFEFYEPDGGLWLDNIQVYEANVTEDPEHVRFEYNATTTTKTVSLDGFTYLNAKGISKSGSLSLAAFASEVLMKQPSTSCTASGSILREYWANVNGPSVSEIPLNTTPTSSSQLTSFESPSNVADYYGQRIRGYICAPATGNYTFYIASNDDSELYLSTNDNPANKTKIASMTGWAFQKEWTKFPSQKSVAIALQAGQKYYIEALHKENNQSDNLAVGWTTPNNSTITVIPGSVLSPFVPTTTPSTFYRAINVNGSALSIDNNSWEASTASNFSYTGNIFSNQTVTLNPATDDNRAAMIRSSVFSTSATSATLTLSAVPAGTYAVFLYVWEDNAAATFDISLEGTLVKDNYNSGAAGSWARLYLGQRIISDGNIQVMASGGDGNMSGLEVHKVSSSGSRLASEAVPETAARVYPNPFTDQLTISFEEGQTGSVSLTVVDLLGKSHYQTVHTLSEHNEQATIDLAGKGLKPGIYLLKIQQAHAKASIIKLIKH